MCDTSFFGTDVASLPSQKGTSRNTTKRKFLSDERRNINKIRMQVAMKTDLDNAQISSLQKFPLYIDSQNNHYEADLLSNYTLKPIPFSSWIKTTHNKNQLNKNCIGRLLPSNRKRKLN